MGAGASLQAEEELKKPLDASDVATPRGESAKAEVQRLRALLAANASAAPPATAQGAPPAEDQPVEPALHMTLIVWNFKEADKCKAWLDNFTSSKDGFPETAEAPGITVCRLYVDAEREQSPGFYEEWKSQEAQTAYATARFKAGFMNEYFDVDPDTYEFKNLFTNKERDPSMARTAINGTLLRGVVPKAGAAGENKVACSEVYDFKDASTADAWISAFSAPKAGFDALAEKAAMCKLFRDDKEPATCGIYTEWVDAEAQKQSLESRAADIEETRTSLKDGARPEIHVYNMLMTDSKDGAVL